MSVYNGNDTFPTGVTITDDGDNKSASSVDVPFEGLADRTKWLKTGLEYIDVNREGVRRFRYFSGPATLRASTDHVDATFAIIPGLGLYEFIGLSSGTDDGLYILKPNDVSGNGRWHMRLIDSARRGEINGIASLDASAKVPVTQLSNQRINYGIEALPFIGVSTLTFSSFTWTFVAGDLLSMKVLVHIEGQDTDTDSKLFIKRNGSALAPTITRQTILANGAGADFSQTIESTLISTYSGSQTFTAELDDVGPTSLRSGTVFMEIEQVRP